VAILAQAGSFPATAAEARRDLASLTIEQLADVEVVTASRKNEKRSDVPAAVFVITGEELRRAGCTRLVEALRLAPGVDVARISSNQWATGVRGFTSRLSRAMLVLIDGRSVYTPLYAGVYWEVQDVLLEDVDRIEVVRGPGGSLWGANAVNGIVNVITKRADRTRGLLTDATLGSETNGAAVRFGARAGAAGSYRVYGKVHDGDAAFHADRSDFDDWRIGQGGFRSDWDLAGGSRLTVQGDAYDGKLGERAALTTLDPPLSRAVERDTDVSGSNILSRWEHGLAGGSQLTLQAYFDRTERRQATFREDRDTLDLDVQHWIRAAPSHEIVYGAGYRHSVGATGGVPTVAFEPTRRGDDLFTAFAQDKVSLRNGRLSLVLGSKVEHNDYSGFEAQPSVRALWHPAAGQALWGAVSRAVRTPTRLEHDLVLTSLVTDSPPTFLRLVGNPDFDTERFLVYEVGYRIQPSSRAFIGVAGFHNRIRGLLSLESGAPFLESDPPPDRIVIPLTFDNRLAGSAQGVEIAADTAPLPWWRVSGAYSFLRMDLRPAAGSTDTTQAAAEGASPRHKVVLRSSMDLPRRLDLDLFFRFVDRLPAQSVGSYGSLDLRLAWRAEGPLELALVGHNLLQDHHPEFGGGVEVERAVLLNATGRW